MKTLCGAILGVIGLLAVSSFVHAEFYCTQDDCGCPNQAGCAGRQVETENGGRISVIRSRACMETSSNSAVCRVCKANRFDRCNTWGWRGHAPN